MKCPKLIYHNNNQKLDFSPEKVTENEGNRYFVVLNYFPYGKILREYVNTNSGDPEKFLTTQHERDQETGFDYRGARFYDSDIARFLGLDVNKTKYPSFSPYNYVSGNPISLIDSDGKDPVKPAHYSFLSGSGMEIYNAARSFGASPQGALVVLSQASVESSWGQSSVAKQHYNFFGIMGGGSGVSTSHGELASYGNTREGINAYFNLLNRNWPTALETIQQNQISADDWNRSLNTGSYQKYPAYFVPSSGHTNDYGDYVINQMLPGVQRRFLQAIDYDISIKTSQLESVKSSYNKMISSLSSNYKTAYGDNPTANFTLQNRINRLEMLSNKTEKSIQGDINKLQTIKSEINGN